MCHAACILSTTTHIITTTTNNTNDYYKATTATKRHSLLTIYNHYHVQMPSANLVARAQHHLSCAGGNPLGLAGGGPKKKCAFIIFARDKAETDLREHHHWSCAGGNPLGLAGGVQKKRCAFIIFRQQEWN